MSAQTNSAERQKALGQVFSGPRVSRLLAALADAPSAGAVLDPMCGSGDLLLACASLGVSAQQLTGIEIDPEPLRLARLQLGPKPTLVSGDAFSPTILRKLPARGYPLVIANPPYVRYQRLGVAGQASQVRASLGESLRLFPHLDDEDRRLFALLVSRYSGLADLAIPAWLLSAMLVEPAGRLALVVPAAWLSRDYARPAWYTLLRWFRLRFVVEDADGDWFRGRALVRTTLVVAERVERRASADGWGDQKYLRIRIHGAAADDTSLVSHAEPQSTTPEIAFSARMHRLLETRQPGEEPGLWTAQPAPLQPESDRLAGWTLAGENDGPVLRVVRPRHLPLAVQQVLPNTDAAATPTTLGELGWDAGQGLRTGANRFFYVTRLGSPADGISTVKPDPVFGFPSIEVPDHFLLAVLRRQAELPDSSQLDAGTLAGRALVLHGYVLPEQLREPTGLELGTLALEEPLPLPAALAALVRAAASTNLGTADAPRFVPDLSAVRTNASGTGPAAKHWYHLPNFTARHRPALLIPRINSGPVATFRNAPNPVLVDANFSTLWPVRAEAPSLIAVSMLLRSAWCQAILEASGTILGAGALKVEATHLRSLLLPTLPAESWMRLEALGGNHDMPPELLTREVDRLVLAAWVGAAEAVETAERLRAWVRARVQERSG